MGHSSIPSLNKTGQSNYWNFMWDDKHNYSRSLHESLFLQEFVVDFFENFSLRKMVFNLNNHDFNEKNLEKYRIFLKNKFNCRDLNIFVSKERGRCFFSKIWVLKYQKKVVIFFFMYAFFLTKKEKKKKKKYYKLKHLNIILNNFVKTTYIFKYEKLNFSNLNLKKNNF